MRDIKEGNLVRISPLTSDLSYGWQRRVGLVLRKDTWLQGDPTSIRWICNFVGEIRSISENSLEVVQ